ncbi:hypothetical protein [Bdellovibrio sp. HCB2-146]|uniref:hypothetical protein n=1 Tax=Bdellovibrio sp. HCB2-146 TaxID=3394362 RepID=UPI0039BD0ED0
MGTRKQWIILLLHILIAVSGCASSKASKVDEARVSEVELQDEIQRFTTQFMDRLSQSLAVIHNSDKKFQAITERQGLRYGTSALDIATGPRPELNLLDMMTFMRLNREALEKYWIPRVYGKTGNDLLDVFVQSEKEIFEIAAPRMTNKQMEAFENVLAEWKKKNPNQVLVEGVRLTAFAKHRGQLESKDSQEVSGLISGMQKAVTKADDVLMLANRAIFLGQRMPALLRLHARIGAQEITSDTLSQLNVPEQFFDDTKSLTGDLVQVMSQMNEMMKQAGPLMREFRTNFPYNPNSTLAENIKNTNTTIVEMRKLLADVSGLTDEQGKTVLRELKKQINETIWTAALAFAVLGFLLISFWWTGYYFMKRRKNEN